MADEGKSEEREYNSDELESMNDDVEAHSLGERPIERAADEGDDVEAHVLSEAPPSE